jgi:Polyketide cyclase / dehydrase and lipid transport
VRRVCSTHSVVIARPVAEVFEYTQDVGRESEWQEHLVEARQLTEGPVGLGTRRHYVVVSRGRRIESTYVVIAFAPELHVTYETPADHDPWSRWHVEYQPVGTSTRVTMQIDADLGGLAGLMPRTLLVAAARRELSALLARLKQRLERS